MQTGSIACGGLHYCHGKANKLYKTDVTQARNVGKSDLSLNFYSLIENIQWILNSYFLINPPNAHPLLKAPPKPGENVC